MTLIDKLHALTYKKHADNILNAMLLPKKVVKCKPKIAYRTYNTLIYRPIQKSRMLGEFATK